ncbi:MAG: cryptochrome/photolyase family protein [Leadbetterella sp.]|nr:cryptochrome/photolyase family protein [Leadbetterella sp.]
MKTAALIFPHQLFENSEILTGKADFYIIEESLFFKQFNFHKQKLWFHRASMKSYGDYLRSLNKNVYYIDSTSEKSDIRLLILDLIDEGYEQIIYIDPTDDWLEKRIKKASKTIVLKKLESPLFLNSTKENKEFFDAKKRMFQADFYIYQRKKTGILVDTHQKPIGEKWSFDEENRKKYPSYKTPPYVQFPVFEDIQKEASDYINSSFTNNSGHINPSFNIPIDFKSAKTWLDEFLETRLQAFGDYEDAIVRNQVILNHSLLSPLMNVGLLTVDYVLDKTLDFAKKNEIPINSLEGFLRQIIGWREYLRAVYELKGVEERTKNFWKFKRKIPASFYDGTTGILPIDTTIKKILQTGYCHHIERLMVLGNFMLLCEFDPEEVYRWFMELFLDAYDWVMVPNVYGMSQFADGGLMSTKPYISGSNYILKMSDYPKGPWQETWDGLYWRFIHQHRGFFSKNPRLNMMVNIFDKMDDLKQAAHLRNAEEFLGKL